LQPDPEIDRLIRATIDVLRERREATDMSKKRLSEESGVTRTAIILMERYERSPSAELLFRLCRAMGVTLSAVVAEAERRSDRRKR
jgi:transcriptional regulator with XRE-family HTH domain